MSLTCFDEHTTTAIEEQLFGSFLGFFGLNCVAVSIHSARNLPRLMQTKMQREMHHCLFLCFLLHFPHSGAVLILAKQMDERAVCTRRLFDG